MSDLVKYLDNTLGVEMTVSTLEKQLLQLLPFYITATYNVKETTICNQRICLLIAKKSEKMPTPDQLFKQMNFVFSLNTLHTPYAGLSKIWIFCKKCSFVFSNPYFLKVRLIAYVSDIYPPLFPYCRSNKGE